jgi:topoisomerase-4 subunit A
VVYKDGNYELTSYEFTNRYELNDILILEKFIATKPLAVVYYDGEKEQHFVKRFLVETTKTGTKYPFISEAKNSQLLVASSGLNTLIELTVQKGKGGPLEKEQINLDTFIDIKGWKSLGNRLSMHKVKKVHFISAETFTEPETPETIMPELDFGDGETYEQEIEEADESPISKSGLLKKATGKKDEEIKLGSQVEWDMKEEKKKNKSDKDKEQGSLF